MKTINNHNSIYANPSDTKANWESVNPVIPDGVIVIEKDTKKMKVGDGASKYKSVPYISGGSSGGGEISGLTTAGLNIAIDDTAILRNFGIPQGYLEEEFADYQEAIINVKWSGDTTATRPESITAEVHIGGEANTFFTEELNSSNNWSCTFNLVLPSNSGMGPFNIYIGDVLGYSRKVTMVIDEPGIGGVLISKTYTVTYTKL